ncbi:hypothetical protein [Rhizobium ruizarguesonis]|uniref:hypothetical protein n=1 Tax=Rhizobium ruizarguesonis TaxID=2081791 RepID=UPI00102F52D5|nr:hypothetical protein [Rhizobium ruizarguesonis]TBE06141.1 hypothetical protein ELH12_08995 [Rhizobium ruizarguesonis]TBE77499.1 hypothetical protein ELH01_09925 [Rhizobium ruizarguesonis]TBE86979.1 hypothetical protein ELG99_08995 [Rhizobium ruizarguesonis]
MSVIGQKEHQAFASEMLGVSCLLRLDEGRAPIMQDPQMKILRFCEPDAGSSFRAIGARAKSCNALSADLRKILLDRRLNNETEKDW